MIAQICVPPDEEIQCAHMILTFPWGGSNVFATAAFGLMALFPSLVHAAALGVPGDGTNLSGIGVISGWKCQATEITVEFLNAAGQRIVINEGRTSNPVPVLYGSERPDVLNVGACDSADVGFVAIWNWGELGDGDLYGRGLR